jgi:hypothetical protein
LAPKTILRVDKASVNINPGRTVGSEGALCACTRDESTLNLAVESTPSSGHSDSLSKNSGQQVELIEEKPEAGHAAPEAGHQRLNENEPKNIRAGNSSRYTRQITVGRDLAAKRKDQPPASVARKGLDAILLDTPAGA